MIYFLAALVVSALLPVAGWRRAKNRAGAATFKRQYRAAPATSTQSPANVASSVNVALRQLVPLMADQDVRADVAVGRDLRVQISQAVLAELLGSLLTEAINHAPGGRLLVTAVGQRKQVTIGVTDDRPWAHPAMRRNSLTSLAEQVCHLGGGLFVDEHPGEGTTVNLRLVAPLGQCTS